jgi:hypothetical protein
VRVTEPSVTERLPVVLGRAVVAEPESVRLPSVAESVAVVASVTVLVAVALAVRLPSVAERLAVVVATVVVAEPASVRLPSVAVRLADTTSPGWTAPIDSPLRLAPVVLRGWIAPIER